MFIQIHNKSIVKKLLKILKLYNKGSIEYEKIKRIIFHHISIEV